MDLVKRGRDKIKEGDCVSVKSNYFSKEFEKYMHELGFADGIIYGRVTEVKDGNRDFTVTWDIDGQVSKHMTLEKVKLESRDTPLRVQLLQQMIFRQLNSAHPRQQPLHMLF